MIFDDTELLAVIDAEPAPEVVPATEIVKAVRAAGKKAKKSTKRKAAKAKPVKRTAKKVKKAAAKAAKRPAKAPKAAAKAGETKAGKKSTRPNALGKTGRRKGAKPVERRGEVGYGKAIAKARKAKEWSGRVAAEKLGITQPALCNIERATVKASEKLKARIKKVFGV